MSAAVVIYTVLPSADQTSLCFRNGKTYRRNMGQITDEKRLQYFYRTKSFSLAKNAVFKRQAVLARKNNLAHYYINWNL